MKADVLLNDGLSEYASKPSFFDAGKTSRLSESTEISFSSQKKLSTFCEKVPVLP